MIEMVISCLALDHDDALRAELQALLDGMRICKEQRKSMICIEVDATMVINMLKNMNT